MAQYPRSAAMLLLVMSVICGHRALADPFAELRKLNPKGGRLLIPDAEEWRIYQERVKAAYRAKLPTELVWGHASNQTYHREVPIWVKVDLGKAAGGQRRGTLQVFLEDTIGNRVRTVPESVLLEPTPPLRVIGPGRKPTRDGSVAFEMEWPVGKRAEATVRAMPFVSSREVFLGSSGVTELLPSSEPRVHRMAPTPDQKDLQRRTLEFARERLAAGETLRARRYASRRARSLLQSRQYLEAQEALELAEREFNDPISIWLRGQLLRQTGRVKDGEAILDGLAQKHPDSVPAQFIRSKSGEVWFTPYNAQIRDARSVP